MRRSCARGSPRSIACERAPGQFEPDGGRPVIPVARHKFVARWGAAFTHNTAQGRSRGRFFELLPMNFTASCFPRFVIPIALLFSASPLTATIIQTNYGTADGSVPGFAVSTTDLLQTSLSSSSSTGTFYGAGGSNLSLFHDGVFTSGYGNASTTTMPQNGTTVTFAFNLTTNTSGYSLSMIRSYASWGDDGRDGQQYTVSYSTVSAPSTFLSLTTIARFDAGNNNTPSTMVQLTDSSGMLATNVAQLRFTFNAVDNNGTGYREFDVFGSASAIPEPSTYAAVVGLSALARIFHEPEVLSGRGGWCGS